MTGNREQLGRLVRETWVAWAREQADPKPSWLAGWDELDDGQREVDMRIGAAVAVAERERIASEIEASIVPAPERYDFWPCTCADGTECFPHACTRAMNEVFAGCGEDTWPVVVAGAMADAVEPLIRRDAAGIARRAPGTPRPVPGLDPDCRVGKHASCLGPPCGCPVHGVHTVRHLHEVTP